MKKVITQTHIVDIFPEEDEENPRHSIASTTKAAVSRLASRLSSFMHLD